MSISVFRGWAPKGLEKFGAREHRGRIDRTEFPEITHLRTIRYLTAPGELVRPLTNISLDRAVEAALTKDCNSFRPDVIHVHTELLAPAAVKVAARFNLPVVVTIHGENTNKLYIQSPRQAERFKAALSSVDRIVIVGEPLRAYVAHLADRDNHIVCVWNGVEPPVGQRRVPTPDVEPLQLICVANLQEGKGVDLLIEALVRLLPKFGADEGDWLLTIIGDGPLRRRLQHQAETPGLKTRVVFAGTMANTEVFDRLLSADIFVLPSYREAFGVAYVEAMASGLLTIGIEGQGPSQFIDHNRTGLLVRPHDVDSLEAALQSVFADPARRWRAIAAAGADFARNSCNWDGHSAHLLEVFRSVTADRTNHSSTEEQNARLRQHVNNALSDRTDATLVHRRKQTDQVIL